MGEKKKVLKMLIGIFLIAIIVCIGVSYNQSSKTINKNINIDKSINDIKKNTFNETSKGSDTKPEKIAYITIDDGPSKYTSQILDILDSNNVKGTFFMLNNNMILHKEEVNRIIKEGHVVCFHMVVLLASNFFHICHIAFYYRFQIPLMKMFLFYTIPLYHDLHHEIQPYTFLLSFD